MIAFSLSDDGAIENREQLALLVPRAQPRLGRPVDVRRPSRPRPRETRGRSAAAMVCARTGATRGRDCRTTRSLRMWRTRRSRCRSKIASLLRLDRCRRASLHFVHGQVRQDPRLERGARSSLAEHRGSLTIGLGADGDQPRCRARAARTRRSSSSTTSSESTAPTCSCRSPRIAAARDDHSGARRRSRSRRS